MFTKYCRALVFFTCGIFFTLVGTIGVFAADALTITNTVASCTSTNVTGNFTITVNAGYTTNEGSTYELSALVRHPDGSGVILVVNPAVSASIAGHTGVDTIPVSSGPYNVSTLAGYDTSKEYVFVWAMRARNCTLCEWILVNPTCNISDDTPANECNDLSAVCGGGSCGASKKCEEDLLGINRCVSCTESEDDECSPANGICGVSGACGIEHRKCVLSDDHSHNVCSPCDEGGGGGTCKTQGESCTPGTVGECCLGTACDPATNTCSVAVYNGPTFTIEQLLAMIYSIGIPAGLGLGGFFIILAGYKLKTSEGNPQIVKEGQEDLTHAIIGTLFVLLSMVILRIIIKSIFGLSTSPF